MHRGDMADDFSEAQAVEALSSERDLCAQRVIEFMAACGVRTTTTPPQLLELLTLYGLKAVDIGRELVHAKRTLDEAEAREARDAAATAFAARGDSGMLPTTPAGEQHESGRRRRGSAEITRKVVLA
jgi:hypothetical protein